MIEQPLATFLFLIIGGIFSLVLANRLHIPSILFFLLTGVFLGPEFAGLIQPKIFHANLSYYIALLVALILFEGGTSLRIAQYRRISRPLKKIILGGALVTLVGTSAATRWVTGMGWPESILFGAIMIVTGPTVVIPILQRLRIKQELHHLLKWEAILIDPIGVVLAVVIFEFLSLKGATLFGSLLSLSGRVAVGVVFGLFGGWAMKMGLTKRWLLRFEGKELGGLYVLAVTMLSFGLAEAFLSHAGLFAATVAGIYLGNQQFASRDDVFHFDKQLTLFSLSILFVLLSSNVPISALRDHWVEGVALLGVLILVIRPASVFLSLAGDRQWNFREKMAIGLLAPRGIVSASLASLFSISFAVNGTMGHEAFLPLAFLLIVGTIVAYAVASPLMVKVLNVEEDVSRGIAIVGANALAFLFARELMKKGRTVKIIDTNPVACLKAADQGLEAYHGSGFDTEFLESLDLKGIGTMLALTPNHEVNILSCQAFSQYVKHTNLFRLWHPTDADDIVAGPSYDATWGQPLLTSREPGPGSLWALIDSGKFTVREVPVEEGTEALPGNLRLESIGYPLFAWSDPNLTFPAFRQKIPKGGVWTVIAKNSEGESPGAGAQGIQIFREVLQRFRSRFL